ncbi:DNA repair protein RecO [Leptobacterium flavescens]|uniref:DNA repair protein RecO n=1 Tax=Leptobacterium flavescens TaxID=472055 RepID=A0A6P0UR04_9FLAO|nr:DNA repair protein RecO [Leptobacterium flavescens]NER14438.1 DNA repair protein RecO [Leptobacterium flavescens]
MIVATKAIVISTVKYGDSSLIVKCFTASDGVKSYLLKGVRASKKGKLKAAYFQPLTQLEIIARHKGKGTLESLREARISFPYASIHTDIKKNAIAFFLAEVLSVSIREEEEDAGLFSFLETAFQWLDTHDEISNFHILFLFNLTRYFGFYPDDTQRDLPYFDLVEGEFTGEPSLNTVKDENLTLLRQFLGINFDDVQKIKLTKKQRHSLLNLLIVYFELHLQGFRKPKSLLILNEVFN